MIDFKFQIPTEMFFGKTALDNLPELIRGKKVLLTYGGGSIKKNGLYKQVVEILEADSADFAELAGIDPNPKVSSVHQGVKLIKERCLDFILAVGGGSVVDCSKCISRAVYYDGDPWEMVKNAASVEQAVPLGCIITLAATGTENNQNAVISNDQTLEKIPSYDTMQIPRFALMNPEYTYSVNAYHTAAGAVDIMAHVFEQYFSPTVGAMVADEFAIGILKTCLSYAPVALLQPTDYEARANLMWASAMALNGLLAAGKATDWASHQIEHGVSAISDITHGVGLAIIFPAWMDYVLGQGVEKGKFETLAEQLFALEGKNKAKRFVLMLREFFTSLGMPSKLSQVGVKKEDLETMAQRTMLSRSYIGGFYKLKQNDVLQILQAAY